MRPRFALFAERLVLQPDGRSDIIGIINRTVVPALAAKLVGMQLVISLDIGRHDDLNVVHTATLQPMYEPVPNAGDPPPIDPEELQLEPIGPAVKITIDLREHATRTPRVAQVNLGAPLPALDVHKAGKIYFELMVDGVLKHRIPFTIAVER